MNVYVVYHHQRGNFSLKPHVEHVGSSEWKNKKPSNKHPQHTMEGKKATETKKMLKTNQTKANK